MISIMKGYNLLRADYKEGKVALYIKSMHVQKSKQVILVILYKVSGLKWIKDCKLLY